PGEQRIVDGAGPAGDAAELVDRPRARPARLLVARKRRRRIARAVTVTERRTEGDGALDRLAGALAEIGCLWVGRVAKEGDPAAAPARKRRAVGDGRHQHVLLVGGGDEAAD